MEMKLTNKSLLNMVFTTKMELMCDSLLQTVLLLCVVILFLSFWCLRRNVLLKIP